MVLTLEIPDDFEDPFSCAQRLFNVTREQILFEALDYWFEDGARRPASREWDALREESANITARLAGDQPPTDEKREALLTRLRELVRLIEAARIRRDSIMREMSAALGGAMMAVASARVAAASGLVDRIVGSEDE